MGSIARRALLALLLTLAIGRTAAAQNVMTISGAVTTRADGSPVSGAVVSLVGIDETTTSDQHGRYTLRVPRIAIRGEKIKVKVDAPGLRSSVTEVLVDQSPITLDVALSIGFAEEVTVGSRVAGAAAEKAVPVDVITSSQIASSGYTETAQVMDSTGAVVQFPAAVDHRRHGHGAAGDAPRPGTGSGARAHQRQAAAPERARAPQRQHRPRLDRRRSQRDPVSAIDHIEILRDGAAAQYGSDAIAGVINIVLKTGVAEPVANATFGGSKGRFAGNTLHAERGHVHARRRHRLLGRRARRRQRILGNRKPGRGSVTVAAEYRHHNRTNRASFDPRDQIVAGDAGNNAVAEPNHRWGDPDTRDVMTFVNGNVPVEHRADAFRVRASAATAAAKRTARASIRRALDSAQLAADLSARIPADDPADGARRVGHGRRARTRPQVELRRQRRIRTQQLRVRHRRLAQRLARSHAAGEHASFDAGTLELNQFVAQRRRQPRVFAEAVCRGRSIVAIGAEHRRENYQITAGEPDSYRDGGVPNQFGGRAAIGVAGVSGLPAVERSRGIAPQHRRLRRSRRRV